MNNRTRFKSKPCEYCGLKFKPAYASELRCEDCKNKVHKATKTTDKKWLKRGKIIYAGYR